MASDAEIWNEYIYNWFKLYTVIFGTAKYNTRCLSISIAKERKILGELNDLRLRTRRFREARVLGVRNPSRLPQCIKKNIWEENFKSWFEDEKKELNKQLTDLDRFKLRYIIELSRLSEIEVSDDMDLEAIIYLKRQRIILPWNGSASLPSSLSVERRQELVSELVSNGIPIIRVSDDQ